VLNAANEIAVARFLDGELPFQSIPDLICRAMDEYERTCSTLVHTVEDVLRIDGWARAFAGRETGAVKSE